jgi:peptide deformylase
MIRDILLLGNEKLYQVSEVITSDNIAKAKQVIDDLSDTMMEFRKTHGFGRAIAAPQIGESYRIVFMHLDGVSHHFINPIIEAVVDEKFLVWDDCMSFPSLEVLVERYKKIRVKYKNLQWEDCFVEYEGDLSELFQHEYDHLDGILAVQRAIDNKAFRMNMTKKGQ